MVLVDFVIGLDLGYLVVYICLVFVYWKEVINGWSDVLVESIWVVMDVVKRVNEFDLEDVDIFVIFVYLSVIGCKYVDVK